MGAGSSAKRQRQSSQVAGLRRLVAVPLDDYRFSRPLIRLGSSPAVSDRGASMAAISSSLHHGSVVLLGEDITSPTRAKVAIKVQSVLTESVAKLDVEAAVYAAVDDPRGHQVCLIGTVAASHCGYGRRFALFLRRRPAKWYFLALPVVRERRAAGEGLGRLYECTPVFWLPNYRAACWADTRGAAPSFPFPVLPPAALCGEQRRVQAACA